jgi:hypothetical protein
MAIAPARLRDCSCGAAASPFNFVSKAGRAGGSPRFAPVEDETLTLPPPPSPYGGAIKDVGHFYQLEKPMQFNAAVKQFIASLNLS